MESRFWKDLGCVCVKHDALEQVWWEWFGVSPEAEQEKAAYSFGVPQF